MSDKILVTYATRYGSTQEVAEAIAERLRERGLAIDVAPARQVQSVDAYRAIVLGAPLYIGAWHKDAVNLLSRHREALATRPVAVFALGPLNNGEEERVSARTDLDKELAKHAWFKPSAVEIFVGKYDPAKLRFPHNLLTIAPASPLHQLPASDHRDWAAIRAWADSLAARL